MLGNATSLTSITDTSVYPQELGSYASVPSGTPVTFTPFSRAERRRRMTPLWTFTWGGLTYSFDATSIVVVKQTNAFLDLEGVGIANITGFTSTPGTWSITDTAVGGESVFVFGEATEAGGPSTGPNTAPDAGTTTSSPRAWARGHRSLSQTMFMLTTRDHGRSSIPGRWRLSWLSGKQRCESAPALCGKIRARNFPRKRLRRPSERCTSRLRFSFNAFGSAAISSHLIQLSRGNSPGTNAVCLELLPRSVARCRPRDARARLQGAASQTRPRPQPGLACPSTPGNAL